MSIELMAILMTAAFQSLLIAGCWIYNARVARALNDAIHSYGVGNLLGNKKIKGTCAGWMNASAPTVPR
jgi:hypothetical protein